MGAADFPPVTTETLPSLIEGEVSRAIGHLDGSLSEARANEFKYYYGQPFGNEMEGESQVVSTDVADTIEGILPIILNIFTASDDVVRFDPNGPEDEDQAAQQTETANYVFYRQNNGFLVLYEWFKDALIQKNGIVKYWWEDKTSKTKSSYQGLTDGEYKMLMSDDKYLEIEELEHEEKEDPAALQARQIMTQQITTQAPPEVQGKLMAALQAQPIPKLHDVTVRFTKDISYICIQAIPPEEFGISALHNCVSIQETSFCYHRTQKSISTLREMGCPEDLLEKVSGSLDPDTSPEALARDRYTEDTFRDAGGLGTTKSVWVTECFYRVDFDGDGVNELRHIIMVGREIWINDETDHINFAALTPIIMPHRWIGRSISELVMDIQFNKSVLKRQMYNNLYLTNNPQKVVLSSSGGIVQANLDDLLTSRPGGVLREYMPNAIRNIETPFVAAASFQMLEYEDAVKENRTGVTRYNQGTDADSLNKTARGIQMIQTAGAQRTNLIARIFAETGVKDLMRGIVYMLSKYSSKAMTLKLRNKWVDVDPREWKTQFNMTVNVGLGTGNRDIQLAHLQALHASQIELMKAGKGYMVSDENLFNLYKKMSEAMGFKHPELFVTDPEKIDPKAKQQPPDPAIVKAQMDAQEGQAKLQFAAQKEQLAAQTEMGIAQLESQTAAGAEKLKSDTAIRIAAMDNSTKKEIEQMKLSGNAEIAVFEKQHSLKEETLQLENKAIKVQNAEDILSVKQNLDGIAANNKEVVAQNDDARLAQHTSALMQTVLSAGQAMSTQLTVVAQLLEQLNAQTANQARMQKEENAKALKPQSISIQNIKTDAAGRITGAEINKTLQ